MHPFSSPQRRERSPPRARANTGLTRVAPIAYIGGFSHPRTVPRPRPSRPTPPDKTMTSPQRQPASRLEELLRARQFVITAEITPPVSCNADDLLRKALPLAGLADAVNVTDGASARLSAPGGGGGPGGATRAGAGGAEGRARAASRASSSPAAIATGLRCRP